MRVVFLTVSVVVFVGRVDLEKVPFGILEFDRIDGFIGIDEGRGGNGKLRF